MLARIEELEEKLEASELALRSMERAAMLGRWAIDLNEGVFVCSEQFRKIYGLNRNEQLDLDGWYTRVHPEDQDAFRRKFKDSLELQHLCEFRHRLVTQEGEIRFLRQEWRVHHSENAPVMIRGFCSDETEQRNMALQHGALWKQAEMGMLIVDSDGFITKANEMAERILRAELVGQQVTTLFGVDIEALRKSDQRGVKDPSSIVSGQIARFVDLELTGECLVVLNNQDDSSIGNRYGLEELPFPVVLLRAGGQFVRANSAAYAEGIAAMGTTRLEELAFIISDEVSAAFKQVAITSQQQGPFLVSYPDRRQTHAWLLPAGAQNDVLLMFMQAGSEPMNPAAAASSDAKSRFLNRVSEWMRTPLNAVLGFQQLISKSGQLTGEQRDNLEMAKKNGLELLKIVNDIQEISQIESAQLEVDNGSVNLDDINNALIESFLNRSSEVKLSVDISHTVPRRIVTDEHKLRQIVFTLVNNAFRFTRRGKVHVHWDTSGVDLVLTVSDTGQGISADKIAVLFEPFGHLKYESDQGYGTSLGLPICASYTRALSGDIDVDSVVGNGATFTVRLPVLEGYNLHLPIVDEPMLSSPALPRVLVVDDSFPTREILKQLLTSEGVVYDEAGNGYEALEKARRFQPEVILMDLEMPVMDGFEATRRIKQEMDVKILAISAKVYDADVRRAYQAGIDGFIEKPYRLTTILNEIRVVSNQAESRRLHFDDDELKQIVSQLSAIQRLQLQTAILGADPGRFRAHLSEFEELEEVAKVQLQELFDAYQYERLIRLLQVEPACESN